MAASSNALRSSLQVSAPESSPDRHLLAPLEAAWESRVRKLLADGSVRFLDLALIRKNAEQVSLNPSISFVPSAELLDGLLSDFRIPALKALTVDLRDLPAEARGPRIAALGILAIDSVVPGFSADLMASLVREDMYLQKIIPGARYYAKRAIQDNWSPDHDRSPSRPRFNMKLGEVATVTAFDVRSENVVVDFMERSNTFQRAVFLDKFSRDRREGLGDLQKMGDDRVINGVQAMQEGRPLEGRKDDQPGALQDVILQKVLHAFVNRPKPPTE